MKIALCLALLSIAIGSPAHAQLHKCVSQTGKITFSDVLCPGSAKTSEIINQRATQPEQEPPRRYTRPSPRDYAQPGQPTAPAPTQAQIYERQLTGKIAGYLAAGDIGTAITLAITPEHNAMIADARRDQERAGRDYDANKRANDAAKRAALPYECKSTTTRTPWDYNNRSSTTTRCGTVDQ